MAPRKPGKKSSMRGKREVMKSRATGARATSKKTGGKIGQVDEGATRARKGMRRRPRKSDI